MKKISILLVFLSLSLACYSQPTSTEKFVKQLKVLIEAGRTDGFAKVKGMPIAVRKGDPPTYSCLLPLEDYTVTLSEGPQGGLYLKALNVPGIQSTTAQPMRLLFDAAMRKKYGFDFDKEENSLEKNKSIAGLADAAIELTKTGSKLKLQAIVLTLNLGYSIYLTP